LLVEVADCCSLVVSSLFSFQWRDANIIVGSIFWLRTQDVFIEEPLPADSELWDAPNLLISPHNMDQTATFMHEATEFFINENIPRFLCKEDLLNPVDPFLGY